MIIGRPKKKKSPQSKFDFDKLGRLTTEEVAAAVNSGEISLGAGIHTAKVVKPGVIEARRALSGTSTFGHGFAVASRAPGAEVLSEATIESVQDELLPAGTRAALSLGEELRKALMGIAKSKGPFPSYVFPPDQLRALRDRGLVAKVGAALTPDGREVVAAIKELGI